MVSEECCSMGWPGNVIEGSAAESSSAKDGLEPLRCKTDNSRGFVVASFYKRKILTKNNQKCIFIIKIYKTTYNNLLQTI